MIAIPDILRKLVCAATAVASLLAAILAGQAAADDSLPAIDFARDVQPIFARRCVQCHVEKREGGLRLSSRTEALAPADSGEPAIVPRDGAASPLIHRVTAEDDTRMPPEGERLSGEEIATLRRWIDAGAPWPEEARPALHWAYAKPVRPTLPNSSASWPANAVDSFILSRLDEESLSPSPAAPRAKMIRRLSLDLRGLPPSPDEVDDFLADETPDAAERLADRFFASPAFGERWARHWLDLARYADSNGFQRDGFRDLWLWRDWVVRAMNADMPFDQFTIEQLAGDLLPQATVDQRVATGFHRCTTVNVEAGTDQEENRVNQVVDRVNTTGAVWLGMTLECAQCHNHKYDPITQQEYYQLFAFFNSTPIETAFRGKNATAAIDFTGPAMEVPDETIGRQRKELEAKLAEVDQQIAQRQKDLPPAAPDWEQTLLSQAEGAAWHALAPVSFASQGKASGTIQGDRSILVGGPVPAKDTYTVTLKTDLAEITALKLETLTDPSLPASGPGRGGEKRPNFVLNKMSLAVEINGEPGPTVKFASASADFSQKGFAASGAIDDDPQTGWAVSPQFGKPHEATFVCDRPLQGAKDCTLIVKLEQNRGGRRTIGRLRLSASAGDPARIVPPDVAGILRTPREQRTPDHQQRLDEYRLSLDEQVQKLRAMREQTTKALAELTAPKTLVMQDMSQPRTTHVFRRGDFLQPLAEVQPGMPSILHPAPDGPPNRLTLALWLVDAENPLVARVTVNRWWAEIFGQGIVATPEDFGIQGEPPTHRELLDWLAVELMDCGWSMKTVLRRIVTSATYRQSSQVTPELLARDDKNRWYARGPRLRLDAEGIRDNALAIAGLLVLKRGGQPVKPPQPPGVWTVTGLVDNSYKVSEGEDAYRRGLYVVWRRSAPYPSFVNFDAQIRATCVVRRSRSNTPLAALTLLNDPVYVEAAAALGRRIVSESPSAQDESRIRFAVKLALAREPSAAEMTIFQDLLSAARQRHAGDDEAPWRELATVLLNLDETITK